MANKQVAVIGLGRFGISTTRTLYNLGYDVLAIDNNDERVQAVLGQCTYAVTADCTSEIALKDLGIQDYEVVIITIQSDVAPSVMISVLMKTLGVKNVIARARDALHANTLRRVGVDRVIQPEEEMGTRLAHSLYKASVEERTTVITIASSRHTYQFGTFFSLANFLVSLIFSNKSMPF